MKVRNGFVSNSSSSSFIVQFREQFNFEGKNKQFLIPTSQMDKLEKFGFWKTSAYYPDQVSWGDKDREIDESLISAYGYELSCNEWEVLEFLVKNKIPFKALCHYEHYYIQYDKGKDYVFIARNFGKEYMMYGDMSEIKDQKGSWEVNIDKFLERGSYYYED